MSAGMSSVNGVSASFKSVWPLWRTLIARVAPELFPPEIVVQVKALACELPARQGVPLSRWSHRDLARQVCQSGLVASISGTTVWRWLHQDAIRPWQYRCWLFPRDRDFFAKASRLLDLYQGLWEGQPLRPDEFVLSADEKTSIQARQRCHSSLPPRPHSPLKIEHEYRRLGSWAYLAAWDVHRAKVYGRCESRSTIVTFDRLVKQVMNQAPYRNAHRVFWIVDNGTCHRGPASIQRLQGRYPNLRLIHGPIHASWLNQVELYFSIVQRKVLTPNDFPSLSALSRRLRRFERHYQRLARPFQWKFTRDHLRDLLARLDLAA